MGWRDSDLSLMWKAFDTVLIIWLLEGWGILLWLVCVVILIVLVVAAKSVQWCPHCLAYRRGSIGMVCKECKMTVLRERR